MSDSEAIKSYLDNLEIFDPKLDGPATIRIRLGMMQSARLTVEYDPGSHVHADFYGAYAELQAPVVATLAVPPAAGVHDIVFDGRDQTSHRRLLIAGTYKLRLRGDSGAGIAVEEVRELTVPAPRAWNYGLDFRNRRGEHEDSRPEVQAAEAGQASLSDGTRYDVTTTTSASAADAAAAWEVASVGHFGSHSSPTGLLFIADGDHRKKSDIVIGAASDSDVSIPNNMAGLLNDCLLLCLAGCRAGNETLLVQIRLNQLRHALNCGTADGDIGAKTETALLTYQRVRRMTITSQLDLPTQTAMGIGPEAAPAEATIKAAQRQLVAHSRAVNPGPEDGKYGEQTKHALQAFQRMVSLPETGLPDAATRDRLELGEGHTIQINLADAMRRTAGADVVIGFESYTYFDTSIDWARSFWGELGRGATIEDAAATATNSIRPQRRKSAELNIYADPDVGAAIKILPARYGRSAV